MNKRQQSTLFITLDDLVAADHPYRKLDALLSFDELAKPYANLYSVKGRKEKGMVFGLRALVILPKWNYVTVEHIQDIAYALN